MVIADCELPSEESPESPVRPSAKHSSDAGDGASYYKNRIDVRDRSACELGCSRMQGIREQERYLVNRIGPDEVLENDDGVSVMIAS